MKKTVLITGANGGIGQALCRVFQEAQYHVIATDIGGKECSSDAYFPVDLKELCVKKESRESFFSQICSELGDSGLNALINNAALQKLGATEDIEYEDWRATLDINLIAPFTLTQGLLSDLKKASGSVVNIGSIHARLTKPEFVCYATSKAALAGLTQSLAVDLGSKIRVNAIQPAATGTSMLKAGFEGKPESFAELSQMHPIGRIAEPVEIARTALFLSSNEASFITGSILDVHGGIGSRLHDPESF